jgi:hypothetical protein
MLKFDNYKLCFVILLISLVTIETEYKTSPKIYRSGIRVRTSGKSMSFLFSLYIYLYIAKLQSSFSKSITQEKVYF